MALQQFTILDQQGMPIGTQVCEGESCYPALQPGQSRVADVQGVNPAAFTTTIDPSGKRLPPPVATRDVTLPAFTPEPTPSRGIPGGRAALSSSPDLPQGLDAPVPPISTQPAQPSGASSPAPLPPQSAPPPSFGRGGSAPRVPTYADGTQHPLQGGPARTPGGPSAQQSDGYDNRQQLHLPTGVAAGPFETRAADLPSARDTRGGYADQGGGGGGGGGSLAKDLYYQIKGNVESRLGGMFGGGDSGYTSPQVYRRQQRRSDRAWDRYNDALYNPEPQEARGWARRALGPNRGDYPDMLMDPIHVATEGMGLDPFAESGTFDFLNDAPAADLAFIIGGTGKNAMTRKTKPVKVPHVLQQQGVKPTKPENPRELDYSRYAAELRDLYTSMTDSTDQNVLDSGFLMGNLADAKRSGALRMGIDTQAEYDPGGAFDRAKGYIDSAFAGRSDLDRDTYARMAAKYFAEEPILNKKPKKISNTVTNVANRFMNQQVS